MCEIQLYALKTMRKGEFNHTMQKKCFIHFTTYKKPLSRLVDNIVENLSSAYLEKTTDGEVYTISGDNGR